MKHAGENKVRDGGGRGGGTRLNGIPSMAVGE